MRRSMAVLGLFLATLWAGSALYAAVNNPFSPNAGTVQGPDPTGNLGYPFATVPATGALPWPVSPASAGSTVTGTLTALNQTITISCAGMGSIGLQTTTDASWVGQISFEATVDGTNWETINGMTNDPIIGTTVSYGWLTHISSQTQSTSGVLQFSVSGFAQFRVQATTYSAGTTTITIVSSAAPFTPYFTLAPNTAASLTAGNIPTQAIAGTTLDTSQARQIGTLKEASIPAALTGASYGLITNSIQMVEDGTGNNFATLRTPNKFNTATATATGSTAVWTPATGKKFRLMRYMIEMTEDAQQAAGGDLTVKLLDGAASIGQVHLVYVPAASLTAAGELFKSPWIDLGNGVLAASANDVLNVNLSATLTAGAVQVIVCGTEE